METNIFFHNPSTDKLEVEKVYGEKWLKFIYNNPLGKLCLWLLVKRAWFSKWYGWRMNQIHSARKIKPFIEKFALDSKEFQEDISSFRNFNEFFYRKLTAISRPIASEPNSITFPADGRHFGFQSLKKSKGVFVKGQKFDLEKLFGSSELAQPFIDGTLVLSRLCPTDYHRFHFPVSGKMDQIRLINGSLNSVNPIALRQKIEIFSENKRYLTYIENEHCGKVAIFLVGATCVGSVHLTAKSGLNYQKGSELGYFSFGGSSLITIFQPNKIKLDTKLSEITEKGFESYAKMGEVMAIINSD